MSNENEPDWIKKADLVLNDLQGNGGLLTEEQSTRFIRKLIDAPTILNVARTVPMRADTLKLNKIGIGKRILRAATENQALPEDQRHKPVTSQVELNAKEVIAEGHIPYHVIEENIEGQNFINTYLDLVAEQAAADLEELILLGDTASADAYLALFDGVIKRANVHTVDALNEKIALSIFNNGYKAMPTAYRRNRGNLRWFMTPNDEADYMETLANRATQLGDAYNTGAASLRVMGIGAQGAAYMPDNHMLMTIPRNLVVGVRRRFTLESERMISERQIKFVLTARVAFNIEELDAIVKVTNVGPQEDEGEVA